MSPQIIHMHGKIQELEAKGCWFLAQCYRTFLIEMLEIERSKK